MGHSAAPQGDGTKRAARQLDPLRPPL